MFEKTLENKFKSIFELQRVRYERPSPDASGAFEQETLFIDISLSKGTFRDGIQHARVTGKGHMFAEYEKLPFGYFPKCISAHPADTKDLFFYEIEENARLHNNIVERSFSFVYFFSSQYDPNLGTLTSIDLIEVTT